MTSFPFARFESFFIKDEGCWIWNGARDQKGYGHFRIDGKTRRAHRVAYEVYIGPIPEGLMLDHSCKITSCVNPSHLEPVTSRENYMRGARKSRITHCPQGHEYSEENTYHRPDGGRGCRKCIKIADQNYKLNKLIREANA